MSQFLLTIDGAGSTRRGWRRDHLDPAWPRHRAADADQMAADRKSYRALLEAVRVSAAAKAVAGPSAARSQDFLYDDDGLPG
jgi:hypothetical protein